MVHGNPTWSFYWRNIVRAFGKTHRAVVPDHLGCGLSDVPSLQEYDYQLASRIEDLCRLIEELDLRDITLLVHDWGGAIGLGAAEEMPDRFSRLVLFNTGAFVGPCPMRIRLCRTPLLGKLAVQGCNLFARAAIKMATEQQGGLPKEVAAGMLAPYSSWKRRRAVYQFVADIPLTKNHPTLATIEKIEHRLPTLAEKEILMIWGMKDWCFSPWYLNKFESIFPAAQVHRFEDAGHYIVEDETEAIIEILQATLNG